MRLSTQGPKATGERYLPEKAIKALSAKEYAATTRAKRKATAGKQVSKQPKKIAKDTRVQEGTIVATKLVTKSVDSTTTNQTTIYTVPANHSSVVQAIILSNTDSTNRNILIQRNDGSGTVNIFEGCAITFLCSTDRYEFSTVFGCGRHHICHRNNR